MTDPERIGGIISKCRKRLCMKYESVETVRCTDSQYVAVSEVERDYGVIAYGLGIGAIVYRKNCTGISPAGNG